MTLSEKVRIQAKVGSDLARSMHAMLGVFVAQAEDVSQQLSYVTTQFERSDIDDEDSQLTTALSLSQQMGDDFAESSAVLQHALSTVGEHDIYSDETTNEGVVSALGELDRAVANTRVSVESNSQSVEQLSDMVAEATEVAVKHKNSFAHGDVFDSLDYANECCRVIRFSFTGGSVASSLIDGYDSVRGLSVEVG